jgi:hypothetical protein
MSFRSQDLVSVHFTETLQHGKDGHLIQRKQLEGGHRQAHFIDNFLPVDRRLSTVTIPNNDLGRTQVEVLEHLVGIIPLSISDENMLVRDERKRRRLFMSSTPNLDYL